MKSECINHSDADLLAIITDACNADVFASMERKKLYEDMTAVSHTAVSGKYGKRGKVYGR